MKKTIALYVLFACFTACVPARAAEPASVCLAQADGILSDLTTDLWNQNDVYWHGGDYPRICALDRIITQADPHFVDCYTTGGWLMDSLGRRSDAEAFYQEGVRNNPKEANAYYSLGMFYFNTLHDYSAANAVYQADVAKCPDADVNDWKMLAHSYERLKKIDVAVATWQEIGTRWPNGPAVQVNLKRVLALQRAAQAGTANSLQHTP